ncbi:MAG: NAD(P)-binding protein [Desulfatibacillaceae bacterium]|nr:NAD(P)-binding protein [Desulfatibacillaceae bacterium]
MSIRIGCYVCHCGINIAHKVRVAEVAQYALGLEGVVVARDYKFMCSDPGQEMIEKDIREFSLNRVVVASCSPRLHEKTFRGACERGGINPYLFQMASVREQVSWVTADENEATSKAKHLVNAAVRRVRQHRELDKREVVVHPAVLVVGGGIAGMQAALDIGASGHKAYLVEKSTTIGGHMLQFDKTFPTLDCAACIGTPKMVDVAQNNCIELLSYSQVEEVSGYIGNYTVKIRRNPRYIKEGVCTGCGECTKVCPVVRFSEWDENLATRKAIYRSFPQAVPITYCIEKKDRAPCVGACPAGINVQGYVALIGQGKYREAIELIRQRMPLPGILGRVCPHPCEEKCRRSEVDLPVAIRDLKRFAADQVDIKSLPRPLISERPEKVAVIGSGPGGLSAAYFLRLAGLSVTIFEKLSVLGGMLKVGIPDYRLPQAVLNKEIEAIVDLGVKVETGKSLGKDFSLRELEEKGFAAVLLAIGAHGGADMGIPGEKECEAVINAVDFLREINLGSRKKPGERVAVIGGGNVAIDAARMAKRLGCKEVTVVYRRTRQQMPAYADEIEGALAEGVKMLFLCAPLNVESAQGRATGLKCQRTELGPPDESGRRSPRPVEGSEFVIECDAIIPAIGQKMDAPWVEDDSGLAVNRRGYFEADWHTMQTGNSFVFACGDAVTGPATVIEAVAGGRRAALAIVEYLNRGKKAPLSRQEEKRAEKEPEWADIPPGLAPQKRAQAAHLDPQTRILGFDEVEAAFDEDAARAEAARCLNCGVCSECMECVKVCEAKAIEHSMKPEIREIKVGSIILATGYDLFDPSILKPLGYGVYPNVFTSLEFERLSNATGPTGGKILIRDEAGQLTRTPKSVAICHCVGSRDVNHHEYCSRVCCMYALKYGHLIKEKVGHDTKIYDFFIDMRCFGKGYEEFFRRCQEEGSQFIRGKVAQVTDRAKTPEEEGKLIAIAEDTLLGQRVRVPVDMVILCPAMEARKDAPAVGRIFGVNQGADGFFLEEHPKLGPLNTATDGVFIAGACQSPKDIPDTVAQASGAAAKALSLATKGRVPVPSAISWIDPDICAGCKTCIGLCPYGAIEFDEFAQVSVVNEAVCKGCGSCSGFCPSGAAQVKHFNKKQVFAEFEGMIEGLCATKN